MSKREDEEEISNTKSKKLKKERSVDGAKTDRKCDHRTDKVNFRRSYQGKGLHRLSTGHHQGNV